MAKRKNPLKDLDAFLKQEATSFVTPEKITAVHQEPEISDSHPEKPEPRQQATAESIISDLHALAAEDQVKFRSSLYDIIRQSLEHLRHSTSEDKMLINTVLYLENKSDWKDNIRNYWGGKNDL